MLYPLLLRMLTVDCKNDNEHFVVDHRLEILKKLLLKSDYQMKAEGSLSLIYGKPQSVCRILISSHIDCVYQHCFMTEAEAGWQGTFDNSATNAVITQLMQGGELPDDVWIAFTGDEEKSSLGAHEVMRYLAETSHIPERIYVLDVTNEGYADDAVCTLENDFGFDILAGNQIISVLQQLQLPCVVVHDAEPDETWDYRKGLGETFPQLPCLSVCIPVKGELHSEEGVYLRAISIPGYEAILKALCEL